MMSAISGAHSDDCNSLREMDLVYAAKKLGINMLLPPIAPKNPKVGT